MPTEEYVVQIAVNALGAFLFIGLVGLLREPLRQRSMAIMLAFAGGVFLFDPTESFGIVFSLLVTLCALAGLWRYQFIGLGWLIHAVWDAMLHTHGHGLAGLDPMSSFGCAVFDPIIAIWFFLGAPAIHRLFRRHFARERTE